MLGGSLRAMLLVSAVILAGAVTRVARLADQPDAADVAAGRAIYGAECAGCHGAHLEGQPGWRARLPTGLLPAPPHDAGGHTWQHSDAELHDLIAYSTWRFFAPNYRTTMPAYGMRLNGQQIAAVIAYLKSNWPPFERAWQAAQNPGGTFDVNLPGDWRFPPDCGFHARHVRQKS